MTALYARTEHGGHPVVLLPGTSNKVQISWPTGPQEYRSKRQAIIALVNRTPAPDREAYDPHMPFDRYFRLGRYQQEEPLKFDLFEILAMPKNEVVVYRKPALIVKPDETLSVVIPATPPSGLGIDLSKRAKEVRKLFFAGFARRVLWYGYDPEDVLQDVYMGIMVRNAGKCPFDPSKASFGHYIHMVCGCIISNYRRRYSRLERNEVFGIDDHEGEPQDVAASDLAVSPAPDVATLYLTEELSIILRKEALEIGVDPDLAVKTLGLVGEGMKNKEIANHLNAPPGVISKIMRIIRSSASEWGSPVESLLD